MDIMTYALCKQMIENGGGGSGGGVLVVNVNVTREGNDTTYTLDKTWQEIMDADLAIEVINGESTKETAIITEVAQVGANYGVTGAREYATDSASGYPSVTIGGK